MPFTRLGFQARDGIERKTGKSGSPDLRDPVLLDRDVGRTDSRSAGSINQDRSTDDQFGEGTLSLDPRGGFGDFPSPFLCEGYRPDQGKEEEY